jgi:hypothetical protein
MVSLSLRPKASCASCGPIVIIRSRREENESEEESEEEEGEEVEVGEEDAEENEGSAAGNSKGIVQSTAEDIVAARSSRKEEKKKAKAEAGDLNDEDADLPVNANRLPVKNLTISDINAPREPSRKERFVDCTSNSYRDLTANQGGQREARS